MKLDMLGILPVLDLNEDGLREMVSAKTAELMLPKAVEASLDVLASFLESRLTPESMSHVS